MTLALRIVPTAAFSHNWTITNQDATPLTRTFDAAVVFPYKIEFDSLCLQILTDYDRKFFTDVDTLVRKESGHDVESLHIYKTKFGSEIHELRAKTKQTLCLNKDAKRISIVDFRARDMVSITIECNHLWKVNGRYCTSWILKSIKKV